MLATIKRTNGEKEYFDLPYGWTKEVIYHTNQVSLRGGKVREDIYLISPKGKKFKSDVELLRFLAENTKIKCDLEVTSTKKLKHREFLRRQSSAPSVDSIKNIY